MWCPVIPATLYLLGMGNWHTSQCCHIRLNVSLLTTEIDAPVSTRHCTSLPFAFAVSTCLLFVPLIMSFLLCTARVCAHMAAQKASIPKIAFCGVLSFSALKFGIVEEEEAGDPLFLPSLTNYSETTCRMASLVSEYPCSCWRD
jgi:hypothetical protein